MSGLWALRVIGAEGDADPLPEPKGIKAEVAIAAIGDAVQVTGVKAEAVAISEAHIGADAVGGLAGGAGAADASGVGEVAQFRAVPPRKAIKGLVDTLLTVARRGHAIVRAIAGVSSDAAATSAGRGAVRVGAVNEAIAVVIEEVITDLSDAELTKRAEGAVEVKAIDGAVLIVVEVVFTARQLRDGATAGIARDVVGWVTGLRDGDDTIAADLDADSVKGAVEVGAVDAAILIVVEGIAALAGLLANWVGATIDGVNAVDEVIAIIVKAIATDLRELALTGQGLAVIGRGALRVIGAEVNADARAADIKAEIASAAIGLGRVAVEIAGVKAEAYATSINTGGAVGAVLLREVTEL